MLSTIKKGNCIYINQNHPHKNWKRVKIFNKYYRLNPVAEQRYQFIGGILTLIIGLVSILFLFVVLAL